MAEYTVVAVARTPQSATGPTLVELGPIEGSLAYTDILNEAGTATVGVSVDTLQSDIKDRLRTPDTLPLEVWVYRDATVVFAGPVVGGEIRDDIVNLNVRGLEFYSAYMVRDTDYAATTTDQYTIAKTLIDDFQALTYGDYGIETVSVGTSGTTRDYTVYGATEPRVVYELLQELGAVDNGFDFWVNPDTRELELAASRGSDLSASVFLERGITSSGIRFSIAPGLLASEVHAIGTGPSLDIPLSTTKSNTALRQAFGRAGTSQTFDPIENATLLGDAAQAHLDDRSDVFFVPGPALVPVVGAGVEDFGVGDLVTYTFDAGLGQVTGTYRIAKRTVTVADSGQETMTVEFT